MKLNQELLNRIKNQVAIDFGAESFNDFARKQKQRLRIKTVHSVENLMDEVCRRYSEQIIKCDSCDGEGRKEINVDGMEGPSANDCFFCEGKGYLN